MISLYNELVKSYFPKGVMAQFTDVYHVSREV